MTPNQIGEASSLLTRRRELESAIGELTNYKGSSKALWSVKLYNDGKECHLNIVGEEIKDFLNQQLDLVEARLEKLGVDLGA